MMSTPPDSILLLGGVRSGKSSLACQIAAAAPGPVTVLASGIASDPEMAARIAAHRSVRPRTWNVVEEPMHPVRALSRIRDNVLLWDSVDSWVGNVMHQAGSFDQDGATVQTATLSAKLAREVEEVCRRCEDRRLQLIAVSSETGMAPIGATRATRQFVDLLGSVNQLMAAKVDAVYLVVAGRVCPLGTGVGWHG